MNIKKLIIISSLVLILTGCNKTLKCEYKTETDNNSIKLTFKKDEVISLNETNIKTFDKTDAYIEMYTYEQEDLYNVLDSIKGINYKIEKDDKKSTVTTKLNINYLECSEYNESLIKVKAGSNYENAKTSLEEKGYSCK